MRARRFLSIELLQHIAHSSFDDPAALTTRSSPRCPRPDVAFGPRAAPKSPRGCLPTWPASTTRARSWLRERRPTCSGKINYLKRAPAVSATGSIWLASRSTHLDEIEHDLEEATAIKNQIVRANLRLVVSIAKRHLGPHNDLFERVSDGNYALIRAVDRFDYARGNKFSTYATWAIINGLRREKREKKVLGRFVTGHEAMLRSTAETRTDAHDQEKAQTQRQYRQGGGDHQGARPPDREARAPAEAPQARTEAPR